MIIDLETEGGPESFEADLCIIGAGPAGMSIARRLEGAPFSIMVLESGGLDPEGATQDLARGEASAISYSLESTRLRTFGGTTRHWEGWSLPFTPIDFRPRPWVARSGWPFGLSELGPFYADAHRFIGLGPLSETEEIPPAPGSVTSPKGSPVFEVFRIERPLAPYEVSVPWREAAREQKNLTIMLHANVQPLKAENRAIRACSVASLGGKKATVRAKVFVLATGGIENARLLLASDNLANSSGLVGRCFMEHVFSPLAAALLPSPSFEAPFRAKENVKTLDAYGFRFTEAAAEEFGVLSCAVGVADYRLPPTPNVPGNTEFVPLLVHSEQAPDPESYVGLSKEADPFGVPRARLNWTVDALSQKTVRQAVLQFSALATKLGFGRVYIPETFGEVRWPHGLWPACHHMGTTRMASDAREGVVNADCRAHDLDNLYIAGSSVFPTSGHVNPTYNLVAIAMRLAEHLRGVLKG